MCAMLSDMAAGNCSIFLSSDASDWIPVSPQLVFSLLILDSSGNWYNALLYIICSIFFVHNKLISLLSQCLLSTYLLHCHRGSK